MVAVKICGITRVEDAALCVAAGADAIGLNFYPQSPRCVSLEAAQRIVQSVAGQVLTVGVFVDASFERIAEVKAATGIECVQLHGDEPPELLERLLPHAFKAIRVRDAASLFDARRFAGKHILLDAFVPGQPGGTGKRLNWDLVTALARERQVTLAGGLDPGNVAEAVARVQPFCVDVASGVEVEGAPGHKDAAKVRAFIAAAKGLPTAAE
jgi:phosphoribosylanthranilate isomerase